MQHKNLRLLKAAVTGSILSLGGSALAKGLPGNAIGGTLSTQAAVLLFALGALAPTAYSAQPSPKTSSTLTASASTTTVSGTLTSGGNIVANATVSATALDVTARSGLSWREYPGTVPAGASYAVLGVRAGTEGGVIAAPGGASIGGIWYVEPVTGVWSDTSPVSQTIAGAPDSVRTYTLTPGKPISTNLARIAVTSGASYAIYMAIAATGNAVSAGYVGVIFYNAQGVELRRDRIWFTPAEISLGSVTTNAAAQFLLNVPAAVAALYPAIRLDYAGNSTANPATTVVASTATAAQAAMPALAQQMPTSAQLGGQKIGWFTPREDFLGMMVAGETWDQLLPLWSSAAQHIQMIRLPTAVLLEIPDSTLASMVRAMDSHGIGLGLEIGAANWYHELSCGGGVESYSDPGTANLAVEKLLNAGAKLSAIAMDEPFWFGHYYSGNNACLSSIQDEAQRVAVIVRVFTAAFPNVVVGDIEPFPALSQQPNWQISYAAWVQEFNAASRSRLAFLHMDFDWDQPSLMLYSLYPNAPAIASLAQQVAPVARANGLKVGMIMNGSASAWTDLLWAQSAQSHMDAIVASGINPDQLLFETWTTPPTHTLPDIDGTSLSGLVRYYFMRYN